MAAEKQLGTALKGSKVFAVLPMPLDLRKTQAVLEGAIAEAVAKRAPAVPSANPLATLRSELSVDAFEPQPAPVRGRTQPGSRSKVPLLAIAGALSVALAGTALWYFTRGEPSHTPAAAPPASLPGSASPAVEQGSAPAPAAPAPAVAAAPTAETSILHGKVDELL